MADLILRGRQHGDVRIFSPGEDGNEDEETYLARCWRTDCSWSEEYDTLNDACEYAADHADTGRSEY